MPKKKIEGWDLLHSNQQTLYEILLGSQNEEALTLDDMREELGVESINTVVYHLNQLEKKGYIRRHGDGQIEVLSQPVRDIVYLNLYGTAGCSPTGFFNDDNVIERIPFPAKKLKINNDSFLIEAVGDSMEPAIHSGDLVLVDRSPASNGDTAVVVHNEEAKIKKIFKDRGNVVLQSLNHKYEPVVVNPADIRDVGVVRGVVHNFERDVLNAKKSRP
jgi:repressor LexA